MNTPAIIRPLRAASAAIVIALAISGCDDKPSTGASKGTDGANSTGQPGTAAGAKELIAAFTRPGADTKALTAALKPDKADYAAVFSADFAPKV